MQSFPDLNHLFGNLFSIGTVWLSIFLSVGATVLGELSVRCWNAVNSKAKEGYEPMPEEDMPS
jgi:hypothetical protein